MKEMVFCSPPRKQTGDDEENRSATRLLEITFSPHLGKLVQKDKTAGENGKIEKGYSCPKIGNMVYIREQKLKFLFRPTFPSAPLPHKNASNASQRPSRPPLAQRKLASPRFQKLVVRICVGKGR